MIVEVAACTARRLRLRLASGSREDVARAETALQAVASIRVLRRSDASRSIILEHAGAACLEEIRHALEAHRFTLQSAPVAGGPHPRRLALGRPSCAWQSASVEALRTAVPLWLGGMALIQLVRADDRLRDAPWYVLAWYAYASSAKLARRPSS